MSAVMMSVTAAMLETASAHLRLPTRWPDPATSFACLIFAGANLAPPAYSSGTMQFPGEAALRLTPELATTGFLLRQGTEANRTAWLGAIDHLRGREIFPADRQSFVLNPIEVLGIAVGLATLNFDDARRRWFVDTLQRGFTTQYFKAPMAALGAYVALASLDRDAASSTKFDPIDFAQLSTTEVVLAAGIDIAFPGLCPLSRDELETTLLDAALTKHFTVNDAVEAATLAAMAYRVRDRLLQPRALLDDVEKVVILSRRFSLFAETMRTRYGQRTPYGIKDEYDVQDLLHSILRLHFDDVRPEEHTPSYAGNHSRTDFFLPKERIVIEAKMTRENLGQREVINQLLIDVGRYSKMDNVDTLVCLIYDPGHFCRNPTAIETDVENSGGRLKVRAVVCPHGL